MQTACTETCAIQRRQRQPKRFSTSTERPVTYATPACEATAGWSHRPLHDNTEASLLAFSLDEVLGEIRSPKFADRLCDLRVGRENRFFSTDLSVAKLIFCLRKSDESTRQAVEGLLDQLFADLRKGEDFKHTEVVMALLFALKRAGSPMISEVASVLAVSGSAELGRLSRYAKLILTE